MKFESILNVLVCFFLEKSFSLPPLPAVSPYQFSKEDNSTRSFGSWTGVYSRGKLHWANVTDAAPAEFFTLTSLVSHDEVDRILQIVNSPEFDLDEDLDSVDLSSTYEFYVERSGSAEGIVEIGGKPDQDEVVFKKRQPLRERLSAEMNPIVSERILPFVNAQYADACKQSNASCFVCHSLVRKYSEEERLHHPAHFDLQALVTVVVSLSSFGSDFVGGLYVSTGTGLSQSRYIPLQAGDMIAHQSNLLHGVRVESGSRWSWIMWFKDTPGCQSDEPHLLRWTENDAVKGDPVKQFIHGKRMSSLPHQLFWFNRSASNGFFEAANEMGQFFSERSGKEDKAMAEYWFLKAVEHSPDDPKAYHNLGRLLVEKGYFVKAVEYFNKAAQNGLSLSAFNMAVAYIKGQGVEKNYTTAALWMERANSGQSLMLAYRIRSETGDESKAIEALLRSAQSGHIPALQHLAVISSELRKSLTDAAVSEEERKKTKKIVESIFRLYSRDSHSLNVCCNETLESCAFELRRKSLWWLEKAVNMGCIECFTQLQDLKHEKL